MKRNAIKGLLSALFLLCSAPAWATFEVDGETYHGDFRVEYSRESATGETETYYLYYSITSEEGADVKTVEVTFPYQGTSTQAGYYTGDIIIPEEVEYNDETYSVTAVGDYAFDSCSGLTSIEIPNSVTSIGNYAFYGCTGLTSVEITDGVTSIGNYAFFNCSQLTSVDIPNSVTTIGQQAFYFCYGLKELTIGENVESIGVWAFSNLASEVVNYNAVNVQHNYSAGPIFGLCTIGTFNIGANVTHLGALTFYGNTTVSELYSFNPEPPTLDSDAFQSSITIGVIFVPEDEEETYTSADGWNSYTNIIEMTVTIPMTTDEGYVTRYSPYSYVLEPGLKGGV
ncbi:MAG: leucine-rich repeat domain-containing protein, partial [Prevotella sp.]|nr:leucine-rich repeat domain-containing protein [Prevotella sp.]